MSFFPFSRSFLPAAACQGGGRRRRHDLDNLSRYNVARLNGKGPKAGDWPRKRREPATAGEHQAARARRAKTWGLSRPVREGLALADPGGKAAAGFQAVSWARLRGHDTATLRERAKGGQGSHCPGAPMVARRRAREAARPRGQPAPQAAGGSPHSEAKRNARGGAWREATRGTLERHQLLDTAATVRTEGATGGGPLYDGAFFAARRELATGADAM